MLLDEKSRLFLEQGITTLQGVLNVAAFERAWKEVINKHQALRTSFSWKEVGKPIQLVHRCVELPFVQLDWREIPTGELSERLSAFLQADRRQGFELTVPPLMRLTLIRIADDHYEFVWSIHHLIHDAWSTTVLLEQVLAGYGAACNNENISLEPSRPYRD
jgi:hypothetical protein